MKNHLFSSLSALALLCAPAILQAGVQDRLFDFADAYYMQNGVNPDLISGRLQPGPAAASDTPSFGYQRSVRALLTLPAYDQDGGAWFFTVLGGVSEEAFFNLKAGENARQTANSYKQYVFPRRGTDPVGLGALRQSNLLDLRGGVTDARFNYFARNPLGLSLRVWVSFNDKALRSRDGIKALDELALRNGRDLDGTPIIASASDIESLIQKGLVTQTTRPSKDPLCYAISPVNKDPRDGGIAKDQFLSYPRKADGDPLEPSFIKYFNSFQNSGQPTK